jgi:hypothetical protein
MTQKGISNNIVDLNGTKVSIKMNRYEYIFKPTEAKYFICKIGNKFVSCIDDNKDKEPIIFDEIEVDQMYKNFKINKFNLPYDKLINYFIEYYINFGGYSLPYNFNDKIPIKNNIFDATLKLNKIRDVEDIKRIWQNIDFTGVTDKEYLDLMKKACKVTQKNERIITFKNIVKDFTDIKIQKQLLTFLKSLGDSKLYIEYYKRYNTVTDKELFKLYIDQELREKAWNLYFKLPLNLQKLYHPEIIKLIPWFIGGITIETIKTIEEIELIEWNLYDDEPLKPEYYIKGGILPYVFQ